MIKYLNIILFYIIFTTSQTFASDDLSTVYESENEDVSTVSSDYSEDNRSISSETPDDPSLADGSYSIFEDPITGEYYPTAFNYKVLPDLLGTKTSAPSVIEVEELTLKNVVQFPIVLLPYLIEGDFANKKSPVIWAKFILPKTVYQQYMEDDEETDQDFFEVSCQITNPAQYIDAEEVEEALDDELQTLAAL